ncbi:glycerol-3-phosphate dehydrogenase/oxidase [Flavobacterium sp. Fl-77]|uniref:Glycerol-3-phosphate dehydrogenase/oxidase n=1 Tax=Flavobacterium flavipigmentatum TaxID=2893884 RepID=A0AAJ2VYU9_9FLAO|nr:MULTISPECIES: glycerol-3-phosphate dehydrogenase/oxidase [unclassified Flavobacterium]MDX6183190.1 glycerol-3-phosphate dehydrogenase/oxidase [Flavobacterium sp. Fl-33]MDX6187588.1 glycerol-3-phosphate dehydrogenase/oxidase [Flavobacterium sp. Fl-77]UFH40396.1 glycerol-3-phosphate dehydrogenase/oxidase [Flavobacterium sp. F-70]
MNRKEQLSKLNKTTEWDVIVIGGGASGLGTALDAASRGYKTILVEAVDFAKGTSSRSTKLVHGGVRYLEQGNISLVKEALKERGLMAKNASHLIKNQSFVIPNYNWWGGYFYTIGLTIYDLLAGRLSLGRSKYISKKKTIELLPTVETKGLVSGVIYHDGQFDDSRLAINLAQTAVEKGACLLNYTKVINLLKDDKNQVTGVTVKDQESGETYNIKGTAVINATGVFTNAIMKLNDTVYKKYIVPSQGIHLVFDKSFLPSDHALMIPKTSDGRVLFAVPWHNKIVVGTTDTLIKKQSLEPIALESEIEFVLETAQRFLAKKPTRTDVLSVFAGLRPLAAPKEEGKSTKEVSRSHKIIVSETGLITITGGKWTTYRKIAEDIIDKAITVHHLPKKQCTTEHIPIHGNKATDTSDRENHLYIYGSDIPKLLELQNNEVELKEKLHPDYDYTMAEVAWAIRHEMARTIDDILARRVRLLFLDATAAIASSEKVAQLLAKELGHDRTWIKKQVSEFKTLAKGYLLSEFE